MAVGDVTLLYSATNTGTAITITLAALSQGSAQECTAIVNASNHLDAQLYVQLKTQTGTHGSDFLCNLYFYGSIDGTNYSDPVTGTDAAVTITTGMNMAGPVPVLFGTSTTGLATKKLVVGSVANMFGGVIPPQWGVVVENRTNVPLSTTAADHLVTYIGVKQNVST